MRSTSFGVGLVNILVPTGVGFYAFRTAILTKILLKNLYYGVKKICLQNSFQLMFSTSLTLTYCNTLNSVNTCPTMNATFTVRYLLVVIIPFFI